MGLGASGGVLIVANMSWALVPSTHPLKFKMLQPDDYVQVRFESGDEPIVADVLWAKVIEFHRTRKLHWAVIDDTPQSIKAMPSDYQFMFSPCHVIDTITHDRDGIALVDLWGKSWGQYKRFDESDYPIQTSMSAIVDIKELGVMGDGCSHRATRPIHRGIAYKQKSEQQFKFDKAWKRISKQSKIALWVHYVADATLREKVNALGITVHKYFPLLRSAQDEIWRYLRREGSPNG